MSAHTPGPWRANYRRIEHGPVVAGDGFLVATVSLDAPEHEANARLIAAAPEMVVLLRELSDVWAEGPVSKASLKSNGLARKARALLAKIEGPLRPK